MQNIKVRELDQGFGIAKAIFILALYAVFIYFGYQIIEKTTIHTAFKMCAISLIGTILVGIAFLGLKIMEKVKDFLERKIPMSKEEREEQEEVNMAEEPEKKKLTEKIKDAITQKKEEIEVDTLNAKKTVVKEYPEVPEVAPKEELLPIETPIPKLAIEEE